MSLRLKLSVTRAPTERQLSVDKFGCCILNNPREVLRHLPIIEVLVTFIGNIANVDVAAPENERQQCLNTASTQPQHSANRVSMIVGLQLV